MRICDRCGRQLNKSVKFCIYCGNKLSSDTTRTTPSNRSRKQDERDHGFFGSQTKTRFSASADPAATIQQPLTSAKPQKMTRKQARKALNEIDEQELFDLKLKPKISRFEDLLESLHRRSDFSKADYKHIIDYENEINVLNEEPYFDDSVLRSKTLNLLQMSIPLKLRILEYITLHIKDPDLVDIRVKWESHKQDSKREMEILQYIEFIEEKGDLLDALLEEFQIILGQTSNEQISRSSLFAEYGFGGFIKEKMVPAMKEYINVARESEQTDLLEREIDILEELIVLLSPPKPGVHTTKFSTNKINGMINTFFSSRDVNEVVLRTLRVSLEEDLENTKERIDQLRDDYIEQMWTSFNNNESAIASIKIDVDLQQHSERREIDSSYSSSKDMLNLYNLEADENDDFSQLKELQRLKRLDELQPF